MAQELSGLQAADGEEKSYRHRSVFLRQVRVERLIPLDRILVAFGLASKVHRPAEPQETHFSGYPVNRPIG